MVFLKHVFQRGSGCTAKPVTLVEVVLAGVLLSFIIIGTTMMFVSGRGMIHRAGIKRAVIEELADTLEEGLDRPYSSLSEWDPTIDVNGANNLSVDINVSDPNLSDPAANVKRVDITASWDVQGKNQETEFTTYISRAGAGR